MPGTGGRGPRGAGPGPVCKMSICPHRAGAGAGLHPAIFMDSREALCWSQEDRHLPRVGGPLRETAACRAAGTQDQLGTARPDPTGSAWEARVTGALDTITCCQEPRRRKNKWILGVAACGTGLVSKVAGTQKKKRKKKTGKVERGRGSGLRSRRAGPVAWGPRCCPPRGDSPRARGRRAQREGQRQDEATFT